MLYAVSSTGEKVTATSGDRAKCHCCGGELVAKCGSIVSHHWAHLSKDCDPWSEPETEWHRRWKSLFPKNSCEVVIGRHRADVKVGGTVIEFQKSSISPEEIKKREDHYGKMVWVLDGSGFCERFRLRRQLDCGCWSFRWYHPRLSWCAATKPVFVDFTESEGEDFDADDMFCIKKIFHEIPCGGYGTIGTKTAFVNFFLRDEKPLCESRTIHGRISDSGLTRESYSFAESQE